MALSYPHSMEYATQVAGLVLTVSDPPALNGRWVWRLLAIRAGGAGGLGLGAPGNHTEFLYLDAITGEVLSQPAGGLVNGSPKPGKVDPPQRANPR